MVDKEKKDEPVEKKATLVEHLIELRSRLMKSVFFFPIRVGTPVPMPELLIFVPTCLWLSDLSDHYLYSNSLI